MNGLKSIPNWILWTAALLAAAGLDADALTKLMQEELS